VRVLHLVLSGVHTLYLLYFVHGPALVASLAMHARNSQLVLNSMLLFLEELASVLLIPSILHTACCAAQMSVWVSCGV
jgi:hypothetical protein